MQKTTLGISVGLLGAIIYFTGLVGGLSALILAAGYVLIKEENEWLRKAAVKALVLLVAYYVVLGVVNLIPDAIGVVSSTIRIVIKDFYFSISILDSIVSWIGTVLGFAKDVIFLILGLKAFNQGTISVPVVDDIVNKNM